MESYDPQTGLAESELSAIRSFYFLVFTSNPMKDRVTLFIDDGSIKVLMKRKAFIDLCVSLIGIQVQDTLAAALEEVGTYFLLDREHAEIRHLQPSSERDYLSVKTVFEESKRSREDSPSSDLGVSPFGPLAAMNNSVTAGKTREKTKANRRFKAF